MKCKVITIMVYSLFLILLLGCSSSYSHADNELEELFHDGLLAVMNTDDVWGYMDTKGNMKIDYQFDEASAFYEKSAIVVLDNQYGLINTKGELISAWYDYLERDIETALVWYAEDELIGLMDETGKTLTDAIYEDYWKGSYYQDVETRFSDGLARVTKNGLKGFIDTKGKVKIDIDIDYTIGHFYHGLALYTDKENGKFGYMDQRGRVAIDPIYNYAQSFNIHEQAIVRFEGEESNYGVINTRGNKVFDGANKTPRVLPTGYRVEYDDGYQLVRSNGRAYHKNYYDTLDTAGWYVDTIYIGEDKVLDIEGKEIYDNYEAIDLFVEDKGTHYLIIYEDEGATILYGRKDTHVKVDAVYDIRNELIVAEVDDLVGVIDFRGRTVIPYEYEDAVVTDDGYILALTSAYLIKVYTDKGDLVSDELFKSLNPMVNP